MQILDVFIHGNLNRGIYRIFSRKKRPIKIDLSREHLIIHGMKIICPRLILFFAGMVLSFAMLKSVPAQAKDITDEAQHIYEQYQKSVYQIQVIDSASGKKFVIGSGFQFTSEGHIATNFHVVSEAVNSPERFHIEYLRYDGTSGPLAIQDVDVVHDLAIVKSSQIFPEYLNLGDPNLSKGTRVFSMGNPHDLGMTIVEGTYNGLMEKSLYQKILFSGSINSGMSGGPALNHDGQVIGINVSTMGDQLSFFVPVDYLKKLYEEVSSSNGKTQADFRSEIEAQLVLNQDKYIKNIVDASWEAKPIGEAIVPGEVMNVFKCWGESKKGTEDESKLYDYAYISCSTEDDIFLSSSLSTGKIIHAYEWVVGHGLNPFRFYNLYEEWFKETYDYKNANKEDVSKFVCRDDFVKTAGRDWKVALCVRQYKKYPKLFDVNLEMASLYAMDRGLLTELVALGVSRERAVDLARKFMGEIKWQK